MKTLVQLIEEVGQWSKANFGETRTEHLEFVLAEGTIDDSCVELGSMASLLGIVEEIGELAEAINDDNDDNLRDAVGDTMIYLCDYMHREGIQLAGSPQTQLPMAPLTGLVASIGRLCHVTLKHHQGIRGYDVEEKYTTERDKAVLKILGYLQVICFEDDEDPLYLANVTWETVVKKRNWKKAPGDGGRHDHTNSYESDMTKQPTLTGFEHIELEYEADPNDQPMNMPKQVEDWAGSNPIEPAQPPPQEDDSRPDERDVTPQL